MLDDWLLLNNLTQELLLEFEEMCTEKICYVPKFPLDNAVFHIDSVIVVIKEL